MGIRQRSLWGKKVFDKKDFRQKKIRQLVLFCPKIRPDDIHRVVIVPIFYMKNPHRYWPRLLNAKGDCKFIKTKLS
jgi:hypothetical protein